MRSDVILDLPMGWKRHPSKTHEGQWYYFHVETGYTQEEKPTYKDDW